jgi:hypothetical protein
MKCPICEGKGGWDENHGEGTVIHEACPNCDDTGRVGLFNWLWLWLFNQGLLDFLYDR